MSVVDSIYFLETNLTSQIIIKTRADVILIIAVLTGQKSIGTYMWGSGLQTEAACGAEDIISGHIAPTELPHTREGLSAMQDTPVVYENHLEDKIKSFHLHLQLFTFQQF